MDECRYIGKFGKKKGTAKEVAFYSICDILDITPNFKEFRMEDILKLNHACAIFSIYLSAGE